MRLDQGQHPLERLRERYGIGLTLAQLRDIEARLAAGAGVTLRRGKFGETVQALRIGDTMVVAAFCPVTKTVKTFLPVESATKDGRKRHRKERRSR